MGNSLFGKTLENVRNRVDIKVGTNSNFDRLVRKVNFKSREISIEEMSLIHMRKLDVKLFKPIIIGVSILDLSKVNIIEFFYGYLKPKYGKNVRLLYTDTDSLILHIFTKDFYKDIMDDVEEFFDTSNFSSDHLAVSFGFPIGKNEGVTLLMKDEFGGKEPKRFVGLCPKLYGIDEELRVKGAKKEIVKKRVNLEKLNQCRLQEQEVSAKQTQIKKRKLENYTEQVRKVILTPKDTKRIVLEDKINTLAPGHWRLLKNGNYIPFTVPYPKRGGLGFRALRVLKE